jgi:hypothetical protein
VAGVEKTINFVCCSGLFGRSIFQHQGLIV